MVGPTSFVFPVSFCVKYLDQCFSSCKQGKDLGICTMVEHSQYKGPVICSQSIVGITHQRKGGYKWSSHG